MPKSYLVTPHKHDGLSRPYFCWDKCWQRALVLCWCRLNYLLKCIWARVDLTHIFLAYDTKSKQMLVSIIKAISGEKMLHFLSHLGSTQGGKSPNWVNKIAQKWPELRDIHWIYYFTANVKVFWNSSALTLMKKN